MRDVVIAGAGIVFGWLIEQTWSDPACQVGLMLFLVVTAVMALAFAFRGASATDGRTQKPSPRTMTRTAHRPA